MKAGGRICLLCSGILLLFCSCRHPHKELLEAELRTREFQYRELLDELHRIRHENEALQHEVIVTRQQRPLIPEAAGPMCGLRRITIGRLTGGENLDQTCGDDALYLVVEPRDGADHVIKVPGSLHVTVLEVNHQGIKTPLCSWDIPADKLIGCWHQGIFSTGYTLTLPWTNWPRCEDLRVVVQMVLTDGRVFEADRDIRVRLAAGVDGLPHAAPAEPMEPIPSGEPLPFPQRLDDGLMPDERDLSTSFRHPQERPTLRRPLPLPGNGQ